MKERNTHPIAPLLAEADNLAAIATRLLEAADELEKAQLAADKDSSTTNMDMLEHAKALQRDRAADMRFNIDEYSKRIERYRDADGRDTRLIAAANAALHYIAAIHGAEVPMAPFDADLTASALAGALNPYKTPHGREVDNKMAAAVSTAKQARRDGRECGCGWRGRLEDCLWLGAVGPLCPACRETTEEAEQGQTVPANQQRAGVYHKFNVSRTDGRDLPSGDRHGAEYFVLDVTHDEFAMPALAAYAAACRNDYPALADDMVRRYGFAQPPAVAAPPALPDWMECDAKVQAGTANALERFIDANEPAGDSAAEFRAGLLAILAAAPQAAVAAPLPPYDVFSDDDGDSWEQHPASDNFVHGLQLGDEFELLAGWHAERVTFRVTKVPDDESDDYEVEEVTAPAAAQKGGEA